MLRRFRQCCLDGSQPQLSTFCTTRTQRNATPLRAGRRFQVFPTAGDDNNDTSTLATYQGPPLLFDSDAPQTDFSSLDLAARMTLMFADEVKFRPLTLFGQEPIWNPNSLRKSALTFLRNWDVQFRCDVLPWLGWFSLTSKEDSEDFLCLMQAIYDGSVECDGGDQSDSDWVCFSRRAGVLKVDLTVRFVCQPPV